MNNSHDNSSDKNKQPSDNRSERGFGGKHSRRAFIQTAFAAVALSGCSTTEQTITPAQKAGRHSGVSKVAIIDCPSYEEDMVALIKPYLNKLDLPDLQGKTVVLKPNMVDYRQGKQITTNPAVIAAAFQLVKEMGAKQIKIADGPALYRDTQFLLDKSGIGAICEKLGVEFIDLNLDDIQLLENPHGFTPLKHFYLPRTIVQADCIVTLPKLKTHHWAGMTCSLKNLFGCVPGRKYGWPKNILHGMGVDKSIIDVAKLVCAKSSFSFVDAVVTMEGEGPLNGKNRDSGFLVLGKDLAAVDATCAATMQFDTKRMKYMRLAGEVFGNIEPAQIEQVGLPIDKVAHLFEVPDTWKDGASPSNSLEGGT
jgi:uncharacterized protein (DUF362 family)